MWSVMLSTQVSYKFHKMIYISDPQYIYEIDIWDPLESKLHMKLSNS